MRPKCDFNRRKAPISPRKAHAHFLTFFSFHRFDLLTDDFHCACLLESIHSMCEGHCFHFCSYVFMPDHVHLLILPKVIRHQMAPFEDDLRADFSNRVLAKLDAPALQQFRVRERSGILRHRFWQCGRAYNEVVATFKDATSKMQFCKDEAAQHGLTLKSSPWRWMSSISEAQLSSLWDLLRHRHPTTCL